MKHTKYKQTADKCLELGLSPYKFERILAAYSDLHKDLLSDHRNLNFIELDSLDAKNFLLIGKIIPSYNEFNGNTTPQKLIDLFGEAEYLVAREGSPCFYIKPKHLWLGRGQDFESVADEVSFEGTLGMFRVWFD